MFRVALPSVEARGAGKSGKDGPEVTCGAAVSGQLIRSVHDRQNATCHNARHPSPMDLSPGTRIGPYEVISLVGVGGMGEVYRGRDPRLQRDVALKILPAAFSSDPDRIARFEREARTLAALHHAHIAGIYGFEESNGIRACPRVRGG